MTLPVRFNKLAVALSVVGFLPPSTSFCISTSLDLLSSVLFFVKEVSPAGTSHVGGGFAPQL